MKKTFSLSFILAVIVFLSLQCSSPKNFSEVDEGDIPDWFTEPPKSNDFIYSARTAVSRDMQLALEKAIMDARAEIGRQVESNIKELQKRFIQETGSGTDTELAQQFAIATKSVVDVTLNGSRVKDQSYEQDGKFWRAYVLMEYPIGEARKTFLKNIKNNEELFNKLKATELFNELNSETKN